MSKPTIIWLADTEGWAYDAIVQNVSRQLPDYDHQAFYMMTTPETSMRWVVLAERIKRADVVVAMHWMYAQILTLPMEKTVMMVTGHRGLEE